MYLTTEISLFKSMKSGQNNIEIWINNFQANEPFTKNYRRVKPETWRIYGYSVDRSWHPYTGQNDDLLRRFLDISWEKCSFKNKQFCHDFLWVINFKHDFTDVDRKNVEHL